MHKRTLFLKLTFSLIFFFLVEGDSNGDHEGDRDRQPNAISQSMDLIRNDIIIDKMAVLVGGLRHVLMIRSIDIDYIYVRSNLNELCMRLLQQP